MLCSMSEFCETFVTCCCLLVTNVYKNEQTQRNTHFIWEWGRKSANVATRSVNETLPRPWTFLSESGQIDFHQQWLLFSNENNKLSRCKAAYVLCFVMSARPPIGRNVILCILKTHNLNVEPQKVPGLHDKVKKKENISRLFWLVLQLRDDFVINENACFDVTFVEVCTEQTCFLRSG